MIDRTTILLYGKSNSGKTPQVGLLAEYVKKTLGKETWLYSIDKGSMDTIKPHLNLGIIKHHEQGEADPWRYLNKAVTGQVRNAQGKWIKGDMSNVGCIAIEGIRSFAEELLMWEADQSAAGVNIGGGAGINFTVSSEGETLKIGGSNQSHYKVAQDRMTREIWSSLKLPVPYIIWTSSASKDDGQITTGKIIGPDVIGKALTEEVVRWFGRVYRMDFIPAQDGKPERHILYLGSSVDKNAGNATALGNLRMPLDAPAPKVYQIEPANLVEALQLNMGGVDAATEALKKRMAG
jgi:hypothetical protein